MPSAKMTTWDQAMFLFHAAPSGYRKLLFVLLDINTVTKETLGEYYVRTHRHLIPSDVEIWEFNQKTGKARPLARPVRLDRISLSISVSRKVLHYHFATKCGSGPYI